MESSALQNSSEKRSSSLLKPSAWDNGPMKIHFTKMQGAGNDFIVLDNTHSCLNLSADQYRSLADRHFGVGADQILLIEPAKDPVNDFSYRIINADGHEVEHCGNGARCFLRYVRSKGLTQKNSIQVEVSFGVITLSEFNNGNIRVQIAVPRFSPEDIPFNPQGFITRKMHKNWMYTFALNNNWRDISVVNLGNPHAVQIVEDLDTAPVLTEGPLIESHPAFTAKVNAGFMQILNSQHIRLRVYERGAGETLACGTGACAAVVTGIQCGLLVSPVTVDMRGGRLLVDWEGEGHMCFLSGPAQFVFEGEIQL